VDVGADRHGVPSDALAPIRRRRAAFLGMVVLLPVLLVGIPEVPALARYGQWILVGWCALYAATTLFCVFSRCPRCRALFHSVYPSDNPFSRSCAGCRLSLR